MSQGCTNGPPAVLFLRRHFRWHIVQDCMMLYTQSGPICFQKIPLFELVCKSPGLKLGITERSQAHRYRVAFHISLIVVVFDIILPLPPFKYYPLGVYFWVFWLTWIWGEFNRFCCPPGEIHPFSKNIFRGGAFYTFCTNPFNISPNSCKLKYLKIYI